MEPPLLPSLLKNLPKNPELGFDPQSVSRSLQKFQEVEVDGFSWVEPPAPTCTHSSILSSLPLQKSVFDLSRAISVPRKAGPVLAARRGWAIGPQPMAARPTRVIAIANQKGGVGKTTTAVNLAASIAVAEKRTLLIDFDPQGNASSGFGIRIQNVEKSIYDCLTNKTPLRDVLQPTEIGHLFVAPASPHLAGAELELADTEDRAVKLKGLIEVFLQGKPRFDYIFIDCPPTLNLMTINALVAAERVLVPLQCEYYALEGLSQLIGTIDRVKAGLNPKLEIDGIALTMYDPRNNLALQVAEEVKQHFRVYNSVIPRNVRLSEAPSHGKPALLYDVQSRGAQAYLALAREILQSKS